MTEKAKGQFELVVGNHLLQGKVLFLRFLRQTLSLTAANRDE
jgi:hypothetical protein